MKNFKTNTTVKVRKDALDRDGNGPVIISYVYKGKAKKISTGVSLKPSYLKSGTKGYVNTKADESAKKDEIIKEIKENIDGIITEYFEKTGCYPTHEYLDACLNTNAQTIKKPKSFFEYYEEFLEMKLETSDGCKEYQNFNTDLKAFLEAPDKALKIYQIDFGFHTIEKNFIAAFALFLLYQKGNNKIKKENLLIEMDPDFKLYSVEEINFGNINNVVIRRILILMEFLKYVTSMYDIPLNIFKLGQCWNIIKKKHKIISYTNKPTTITFEELEHLFNFEVEEDNLKKAKDKFVFSCLSSLRESDLNQIKEHKITKKILNINMKKTQRDIYINLNETMELILKRHDYNLKYVKNSQTYNEHLKVLFERFFKYFKANVNKNLNFDIYERKIYGKVTTYEKKKIWQIMSSHKGRSSFVTINLERNMSLPNIMEYTGHTSTKVLKHYNDTKSRNENVIGKSMELASFKIKEKKKED